MSVVDSDFYDIPIPDEERFSKWALTSKEGVLKRIDWLIQKKKDAASGDVSKSSAYYHNLIGLLQSFRNDVEDTAFMDELEPWWTYTIALYDYKVELTLEHYEDWDDSDEYGEITGSTDAEYIVVSKQAKLLSVDEFAETHGIEPVTVRQWIRRGRLRCAIKHGSEWRIPVFAQLPRRGYSGATYYWDTPLMDLPKGLEYLADFRSLRIEQNNNKQSFDVYLWKDSYKEQKHITIEESDRVKLELYLISSPYVEESKSCIGYWPN